MKLKQSKNSVKVIVRGKMLSLTLPRVYCGKVKTISLGISDNSDNRKFAEFKAKQIETDFVSGHFDTSLAKYRPIQQTIFTQTADLSQITFSHIYQKYIDSKKNTVSPTTWKSTYINTLNHLNCCPHKIPSEALKLKDWLLNNRTTDASRRILMQLNAACNWAVERKLIETNPFLGKTKIKGKKSRPKIHPFSRDEKAIQHFA